MHVHGATSSQMMALVPTQAAQQARAVRRAAAEVRKKLTGSANTGGSDAVWHVDAYAPGNRRRRQDSPQDDEAFRNVFVSIQV